MQILYDFLVKNLCRDGLNSEIYKQHKPFRSFWKLKKTFRNPKGIYSRFCKDYWLEYFHQFCQYDLPDRLCVLSTLPIFSRYLHLIIIFALKSLELQLILLNFLNFVSYTNFIHKKSSWTKLCTNFSSAYLHSNCLLLHFTAILYHESDGNGNRNI